MTKPSWKMACVLTVALSWPGAAFSQVASADAVAAAKELMIASKASDQIRNLVPLIMQQLKPIIVQGRPELDREFDVVMPLMLKIMDSRLDAFLETAATIYARHFTPAEMRQITAFYRQPAGQKLLEKQPVVMQETLMLGQQFGQVIAKDLQERVIQELRSRGHSL
jgi:hypothetical protein